MTVHYNPGYQGPSISFANVQLLMGIPLAPDDWPDEAAAECRSEIATAMEEPAFAQHASLADAIGAPDRKFSHNGEQVSVAEVAGALFDRSPLALELLTAGLIDENFTLYITQFPGQAISAAAMNFIIKAVQPDVMDIEYHFGSDEDANTDDIEAGAVPQKVEELLDPDDVAAGHVVRFRRSAQSKIVRSREPAHPAIISVETFARVQLEMRARRGSDMASRASRPRTRVAPKAAYLFRGAIRCESCGRRMEGAPRKHALFYRCAARTLVPGVKEEIGHPPTVYLRESHLSDGVNAWIAQLFSPENLAETVAILVGAKGKEDAVDAAE